MINMKTPLNYFEYKSKHPLEYKQTPPVDLGIFTKNEKPKTYTDNPLLKEIQEEFHKLTEICDTLEPNVIDFKNVVLNVICKLNSEEYKKFRPTPAMIDKVLQATESLSQYKTVSSVNIIASLEKYGYSIAQIENTSVQELLNNLKFKVVDNELSFQDGRILLEMIKLIKQRQHIIDLQEDFNYALKLFPNDQTLGYLNEAMPIPSLNRQDLKSLKSLQIEQEFFNWLSGCNISNNISVTPSTRRSGTDTVCSKLEEASILLEEHITIAENNSAIPDIPVEGTITPIVEIMQEIITNFYF